MLPNDLRLRSLRERSYYLRLWAVGIPIAVLTACDAKVPPYPALIGITRVEVRARLAGRDTTVASIVEPGRVGRIVAFVNARRAGWGKPWAGVPVPTVVADLYRGSEFMGHVGSGAFFLETQREGDFASRSASSEEVAEFNALLGIGTKVVAVPSKHPSAGCLWTRSQVTITWTRNPAPSARVPAL